MKRAYLKDSELFTSYLDGTEVKQLTSDKKPKTFPRWSPDGNKLFYVEEEAGQDNNLFANLVVINSAGNIVKRIPVFKKSPDDPLEDMNDMRYVDGGGWTSDTNIYITGSPSPYYGEYQNFDTVSGKLVEGWDGGYAHAVCPAKHLVAYVDQQKGKPSKVDLAAFYIHDLSDPKNFNHPEKDSSFFTVPNELDPNDLEWNGNCGRLMFTQFVTKSHDHIELAVLHDGKLEARLKLGEPGSVTTFKTRDSFGVRLDADRYFIYDPQTKSLVAQDIRQPEAQLELSTSAHIASSQGEQEDLWYPTQ